MNALHVETLANDAGYHCTPTRQERRVCDPCHERCRTLDRSVVGQGCREFAYSTAQKKKAKITRSSVIIKLLDQGNEDNVTQIHLRRES